MNNKKDIYGGINPIFESLMGSIQEAAPSKKENTDSTSALVLAVNNFLMLLLNSKMENAKTVRGFQEIKNKLLGSSNFSSFRQYIISIIESLGSLDPEQKEYFRQNIDYTKQLFNSGIESELSNQKTFESIKKTTISKVIQNFEEDLKNREQQIKKTSPKILNKAIEKGMVVKEEKIEEDVQGEDEEGELRGAAFNKSKKSLDLGTSFVGMIDRDSYIPALKGNADIERYKTIANDLLKKAQDMQMMDRQGLLKGKIITNSGQYKGSDYRREQDALINELIRQRKEYSRIREGLLKNVGLVVPPLPEPKKDVEVQQVTGGGEVKKEKKKPKPSQPCQFPIKVGTSRCNEVGEIQNKVIELIPSAKDYLKTKGGSDKIYGKATSMVCNIIWGYISNNKNVELTSDLTREKYDAIMKLTTGDIDLDLSKAVPVRDNLDSKFKERITEAEVTESSAVLSFESFSKYLGETLSFSSTEDTIYEKAIIKDSCIKRSIESGKIEDCFGATGGTGGTGGTGDTGATGGSKKEYVWKGLKPPKDNIYAVGYDESLFDFWGKVSIGAVAGVAVLATGGAALGAFAPALLGSAAASASVFAGSGLMALSAASAAISSPVVVGAGVVGGAAATSLLSGRTTLAVTVASGFISRNAIVKMTRGLINTIDGYTSDDDWQAIMSTLCLLKGTWTCNSDETRAISAWSEIKRLYIKKEKVPLIQDITTTKVKVGDVENFPDFSSRDFSQGDDTSWQDAYDDVLEAIRRLEANESKMQENCKQITEEMISSAIEGSYMVDKSTIKFDKKSSTAKSNTGSANTGDKFSL